MLRATHHHQHHNHKYYIRTCVIQHSGTEYDRSCVRIHFLLQHSAARVFVVAVHIAFFCCSVWHRFTRPSRNGVGGYRLRPTGSSKSMTNPADTAISHTVRTRTLSLRRGYKSPTNYRTLIVSISSTISRCHPGGP